MKELSELIFNEEVRYTEDHEWVTVSGATLKVGISDYAQDQLGDIVFVELPAGKIDHGEPILDTARRELLEETGYTARDWEYLGVMHPCIGYSDERIEIFTARGLHLAGEKRLDHNEFLEVLELAPDEAKSAVLDGRITDAKTIAALFWLDRL